MKIKITRFSTSYSQIIRISEVTASTTSLSHLIPDEKVITNDIEKCKISKGVGGTVSLIEKVNDKLIIGRLCDRTESCETLLGL